MSEVEKYNVNNILLFNNKSGIKEEECEETDSVDHKIEISQTVLIIGKSELENHDKLKPYDVENSNIPNYNTATEKEIIANNIKIEFENGLYCEQCHVYYEDYCIKCGMLVHILNKNTIAIDMFIGGQIELPDDILELQNSYERFGIFALKVIPKGVKFGPFTGFNNTECVWKSKGGKFVANKDETKYLNWMKYINPAKSPSEPNLLVFQSDNNLYYQSICEIQEGDELLVHFGEKNENSLNNDLEMDIIPGAEHIGQDVFACTFCCLGFNAVSNLVKHKTVCYNNAEGRFANDELTQCSFCKIYLYQKEYFEHHMTYCSENDRKYVQSPMDNQTTEVTRRKTQRHRIYKCAQRKYRTKYKGDLKYQNSRQHYEVKIHKCGLCSRRFMKRDSLALHMEVSHVYVGKEDLEGSTSAHVKEERQLSQRQMKRFRCSLCEFRTKYKIVIKGHIKTKHLKEFDYNCESCDYKTNYKAPLKMHIKTKHLKEFDYNCESCDFKTNNKTELEMHIKTKHLKVFDYNCESCDFKTKYKANLETHIKTKHLKEFDYNCESCGFKTNDKANFKMHIKTKHLKEFDYNCESCDYKTNKKAYFNRHVKCNHLKEFDYNCESCDFKTNNKANLEMHIKTKHLLQFDYNCMSCDYKTNGKSKLNTHIKSYHPKRLHYNCELCDYKANRKSVLEIHIKTKHLIEFDYKCESCDYKTNRKGQFEHHIKSKHLKKFGYKCESCDFKTNYKSDFKKHVKVKHLKKFDYKCESCDYKTNQKVHFEMHIKSKHLLEFDYNCESCHYKTNTKVHLERHIKVRHLTKFDYKCGSCPYETNYKSQLERHMKTKHLLQFDYNCASCHYKTNTKSHLEKHIKVKHSIEFKYNCESCDYKTKCKVDFEKHMKRKHPKGFR